MTRTLFLILAATAALAQTRPIVKPKLILAVTLDQFRYDYLVRFRRDYTGGLDRLLTKGAVFTNAQYEHFPTVTAIGHSTFLSGAPPSTSGIIGNDWWDRESGKTVTSVSDPQTRLLGAEAANGSSPRRLLVSTLADELKTSGAKSRAIGISWKDRSAILTVGHTADAAYWVHDSTGAVVSSTFYFDDLPAWVKDFNATRPLDKYLGGEWNLAPFATKVRKMPSALGKDFVTAFEKTPWCSDMLEALAERAIVAEQLGKRDATDVLAVSFSANDYIGHDVGPDAPEVHAISVHTDRLLDKLFRFVDTQIGMQNVVVVLTADHGVAPLPELNASRKMPGGRMKRAIIQDTVTARLTEAFGPGKWIVSPSDHSLWYNRDVIRGKKLDEREVTRVAVRAARSVDHVARVYTREQLIAGIATHDLVGRRIQNGYHHERGADLVILLDPYWMYGTRGTTHGTPYMYDAHIPVIFMGPGIRPGRYRDRIAANDIAPTLAALLEIEPPSGSTGRVLGEILF
ncbi:MAG: alkaline phosphatase family protein [Bryobacteraceae bacterium]